MPAPKGKTVGSIIIVAGLWLWLVFVLGTISVCWLIRCPNKGWRRVGLALLVSCSNKSVCALCSMPRCSLKARHAVLSKCLRILLHAPLQPGSSTCCSSLSVDLLNPSLQPGSPGGDSHSSDDDGANEMLETWIIMEYCEKASLERAIFQGRFKRRSDEQPEMVS